MKNLSSDTSTLGAWGLHLSSYMMVSMPYLQITSLVLAIVVSIVTLRKLIRAERNAKKQKSK
jgi:ABC-type nickel/cobalt efflux system permease component RcnA